LDILIIPDKTRVDIIVDEYFGVCDKLKQHALLECFVNRISRESIIKVWVKEVWKPHGWPYLSTHSSKGVFLFLFNDEFPCAIFVSQGP
jgi:hypothetical protein